MCLFFLKIRWRNLPNQVRIWASLHDNKYTNFSCVDNIENVGLLLDILLSSTHLSSLYKGHSITKCLSSSIVLQLRYNLLFRGVLGFVCLSRSISRRWELDRILVNAFRYLNYLTKSKYGSKWKSLFSSLYNFNLGRLFEFRNLERQPSTNFSFIVILISLVCKSGWSISQPYFWAISLTLLTHVRKPWLCRLRNAVKTRLIIVFPGISANLR